MAVVVFDPDAFRAAYPQFSGPDEWTDARLQSAFDAACLVIAGGNLESSPIPYRPDNGILARQTLLLLLVCHLCTLAGRGNAVGALSSASEGSVSATFAAPQIKNAEWFSQTPCGLAYWQATARYRAGGRYYAHCPE